MIYRLPSSILSHLAGGRLRITQDNTLSLDLAVRDGVVVLDILQIPTSAKSGPGLVKKISGARSLAHALKEDGMTVEVRHRGRSLFRLGAGAKPRFARLVTRSGDIEICDMGALRRIGK